MCDCHNTDKLIEKTNQEIVALRKNYAQVLHKLNLLRQEFEQSRRVEIETYAKDEYAKDQFLDMRLVHFGVSVNTARILVKATNAWTVGDLLDLGLKRLRHIEGIGDKEFDEVVEFLKENKYMLRGRHKDELKAHGI